MPKIKLLKKQKPTVKDWCNKHNGKLVEIRDRSCRYREAIIDWSKEILYPHTKQTAIVYYRTSLELTPTGKIRREIHQQKNVRYVQTEEFEEDTQLVLPLGEVIEQLPPPPKNIIRNYLFPRDKDKPTTQKEVKPKQQTLPLGGVAARLHRIGLSKGRQTESTESLLGGGRVDHYSLDQGKVIPLPQAFIDLLTELECSNEEWEAIINFYQVLSPDAVLRLIEEIPVMRGIPQFKTFTHPKPKIITPTTTSNSQPQRLSPNL